MQDIQEELLKLENLLKTHDKYYDYSGDDRRWSKGNNEWKTINALRQQLSLAGYSEEVQELFNKYYTAK